MSAAAGAAAEPGISTRPPGRPVPAILVGGLITGVLDMTYAMLVYSPKNPLRIPQAVATGVFGRESFNPALAPSFSDLSSTSASRSAPPLSITSRAASSPSSSGTRSRAE